MLVRTTPRRTRTRPRSMSPRWRRATVRGRSAAHNRAAGRGERAGGTVRRRSTSLPPPLSNVATLSPARRIASQIVQRDDLVADDRWPPSFIDSTATACGVIGGRDPGGQSRRTPTENCGTLAADPGQNRDPPSSRSCTDQTIRLTAAGRPRAASPPAPISPAPLLVARPQIFEQLGPGHTLFLYHHPDVG